MKIRVTTIVTGKAKPLVMDLEVANHVEWMAIHREEVRGGGLIMADIQTDKKGREKVRFVQAEKIEELELEVLEQEQPHAEGA